MFFSLRNRIFIIFTLLLTVPFLVLSFIVPSWFTSIMENQTKNATQDMMEQYSLYINSITMQAEDLGKQVLVDQTTQQWLKLEKEGAESSQTERLLKKNELKAQLASMVLNNSNMMSFSVFLNDGTGIWVNNPLLEEMEWYKDFPDNHQRWVKAHTDNFQQHREMSEVKISSYLLPLFDINTLELAGVIKVNFPSSLLETALSKIQLGENGRVYLLNSLGENVLPGSVKTPQYVLEKSLDHITSGKPTKGLFETKHEGEEYLVFYQKLSIGDWVLFSEITKSELFFKINQLQNKLLLTSAIIFILTMIASFLLSSNIVSPLGKLAKAMKYMERGDFSGAKKMMPTIKSDNHEVGYLVKVFDQTIYRLDQLIKIEYEANIRRKDAEYKALLLQINPHFMNNTLEIIGGLAAQGKNKEVMNVSVYLGRMMRYSLNTHSDVVELGEEMNYIRNFTDILKVRYEDTISVVMEEDPETRTLPIIKFVIQPLVENAVKYSFIENTHAAIRIKTKKTEDQIIITVEDNGVGMSEEVIANLLDANKNNELNNVLASKGTSIGLKNVLGRLKLYYGANFSFNIHSEKSKGTRVILYITTRGDIHDEGVNRR
ncbi:sensor histidine kinase [Sutcliffiella halmapala]|uniref:sensor histidine kinase n=1 Tax=Sutcliffiella halmapala TaxID=79882 RepID=UPI000995A6AE|nr:sensor histidine kinase [Sutcliffiella halmapala]